MRKSIRQLLLAAVLTAAVAAPASAGAATVTVKISTGSQQRIVSDGAVTARIKSAEQGFVSARAGFLAGKNRFRRVSSRRRAAVGPNDPVRLRLPLTGRGRSLVSACEAGRRVAVRARFASDRDDGSSGRAARARVLKINLPACAQAPGGGGGGTGGGGGPTNGNVIPPPTPYEGAPIATANSDRCDFLDAAVCLHPWPNDYFTTEDPDTDTGRRIALNPLSMPANALGVPIDPTDQNRADGFSPGNLIVTRVPGLDNPDAFDNTGAVAIDDLGAYDDPDQPIVVINADTGQRQPVWAEIDSNPIDPATGGDPDDPADRAEVNLIVRPARNFDEGARYVVAMRNLKDESNATIQPADGFRVFRDNLTTTQSEVESRRAHMEELFATLGAAGIQRSSLYIAWDFTVASEQSLSQRALSIRDDAFEQLGDTNLADRSIAGTTAPPFTVTEQADFTLAEDPLIAREVTGQVTVPCYLNAPGCPPGSEFAFIPGQDLPQPIPGNTTTANFTCEIPRSAIDPPASNPARPSLYGHGLLGSGTEVGGGNIKAMASEHNFMFCATDWAGFSTTDLPTVLLALQDLSNFNALVDRMQQGFVNFFYLGRAMIHPQGFAGDAAFQDGGQSVIAADRLFYDGNSQGGIMGGALTALAPDFQRAVLGVPGMNYSTLLERSVDFEPYAEGEFTAEICGLFPPELELICDLLPADTPLGLYDNYPDQIQRPLIFSLMQMLWDRGEANGYAHHMTTDPLPNTPVHNVLLHPAFGDHQVANITAENEARTIGALAYQPALDPGRHWQDDSNPLFQIPSIPAFPFGGSALVYWDGGPTTFAGGSATPPDENVPPRPTTGFGADPHSYPRNDIKARAQKAAFLTAGGGILNYCTVENNVLGAGESPVTGGTATPCYSHGWTGP
jgi:hypothetical protein